MRRYSETGRTLCMGQDCTIEVSAYYCPVHQWILIDWLKRSRAMLDHFKMGVTQ